VRAGATDRIQKIVIGDGAPGVGGCPLTMYRTSIGGVPFVVLPMNAGVMLVTVTM